jgi:signal transduction histidine kinase
MRQSSNNRPIWLTRFLWFWRVILILSILSGVVDATDGNLAVLVSWRGAALVGLIGAFLACYELFEHTEARCGFHWPVPYRQVLLYLVVQIALVSGLLAIDFTFVGPLFALMGQVFSSLRPRQWIIPIGAIIALAAAPIGIYDTVRESDWGSLIGFGFFIASWLAIALFIGALFSERHQRERLIGELRQAKEDLERYATQAEELAALRERTRLARDMHDSLGHALVVVNVKLEAAQRLYAVDETRGAAELEATRALVRETMGELRRSLADLRVAVPQSDDLPAALRRVADEVRARANLHITCSTPHDLPALAPATAEALWRVAREALVNVERHAAAGSAAIAIERVNGTLLLRVTDDGSGTKPADLARPGHYGITGMRERVEALGGTLKVAERAGGGTVVEASVPL